MCSVDCADAVYELLKQTRLYNVKTVGPSSWHNLLSLNKQSLHNTKCIIFPGGDGNSDQFDLYLIRYKSLIKRFVANGGKYLGICMGGYFASDYYFDILKGLYAPRYIKRKGACTKTQGPACLNITWKDKKRYSAYFHDGAAFIPFKDNKDLKAYAHYQNKDIAALITNYKKGKVAVIGPHLEAPAWWFYTQPNLEKKCRSSLQHQLFLKLFKDLIYG